MPQKKYVFGESTPFRTKRVSDLSKHALKGAFARNPEFGGPTGAMGLLLPPDLILPAVLSSKGQIHSQLTIPKKQNPGRRVQDQIHNLTASEVASESFKT